MSTARRIPRRTEGRRRPSGSGKLAPPLLSEASCSRRLAMISAGFLGVRSRAARRGRLSRCGRCRTVQARRGPVRRSRRGTEMMTMALGTRLAIWIRSRTAFWKRSSASSKKRRSSTWSMQKTRAARSTVHIRRPSASMISKARPSPALGSSAATASWARPVSGRPYRYCRTRWSMRGSQRCR